MSDSDFSLTPLLPVFQFCPRCGKKSFKPNSEKSFGCSNCGHLYFINPGGAVAGLITDSEGRLLLVKRAGNPGKGLFDLPGGFVDLGERAEDALKREIKEELNLVIKDLVYLTTFPNQYFYKDVQYFTLDLAFICIPESIETIKAADDVAGFEFFEPDQIPLNEIAFDSIRNMVKLFTEKSAK
ncbi:MAG: NUDIX domain-containing protein [Bacteroidetes bacterium]|nr:NUDIX domain-containing protein [Bacteroidota bacterium]